MVELLVKRTQTALNVSQALTCRQLGRGLKNWPPWSFWDFGDFF
jgi:hypothetical protein